MKKLFNFSKMFYFSFLVLSLSFLTACSNKQMDLTPAVPFVNQDMNKPMMQEPMMQEPMMEKCYGVSKKIDQKSFVMMPKGLCKKIAGGLTQSEFLNYMKKGQFYSK